MFNDHSVNCGAIFNIHLFTRKGKFLCLWWSHSHQIKIWWRNPMFSEEIIQLLYYCCWLNYVRSLISSVNIVKRFWNLSLYLRICKHVQTFPLKIKTEFLIKTKLRYVLQYKKLTKLSIDLNQTAKSTCQTVYSYLPIVRSRC